MILLIDDESIIRVTVKRLLAEFGYTVMVAEDAESGIALYKQNMKKIKLILLDMAINNIDGKETFFLLKKINPEVKVIIISGFRVDKRIEETLNSGAVDFIAKPFTMSELTNTVKKHLY